MLYSVEMSPTSGFTWAVFYRTSALAGLVFHETRSVSSLYTSLVTFHPCFWKSQTKSYAIAMRVGRQDAPSLADIVVGVTAKAAVSSLGEGDAASAFAKTKAYAQRVGEIDACVQAANAVSVFAEASCHERYAFF